MKMVFRWFGIDDRIPLRYIRQIQGMEGVVTAIYDVPVGEVWEPKKLEILKKLCNNQRLSMEVIESIPVHEDIKLGLPSRDKYIEAFKQNVVNCAEVGVKCVCYNFMPVFDWLRTNLHFKEVDGSYSLSFSEESLKTVDPKHLHLPGWDESYSSGTLYELIERFKAISRDTLFENLIYFLKKVVPTCEKVGVKLAIHPADPPWDMFGLPRIICNEADYDRLISEVPSEANGITFCTGSLGAGRFNDLPKLAAKFAKRIYFAHLRQLTYTGDVDFYENGHMTERGNLDMYAIVKALVDNGFDGYVRPDHGRNVWGEEGRPGYGLYDRAMGASYLCGLFEALEKTK